MTIVVWQSQVCTYNWIAVCPEKYGRQKSLLLKIFSGLCQSLTDSVTKAVIRALITCRLDYRNRVLAGVPVNALDRLQGVQNSVARAPTRSKPWQHIIPDLMQVTGSHSSAAESLTSLLACSPSQKANCKRLVTEISVPQSPPSKFKTWDTTSFWHLKKEIRQNHLIIEA